MKPPRQLGLADDELHALLDWRRSNGRGWKTALWAAWMTGRDTGGEHGSVLRRIRNRRGPAWLDALRPKDLDAAAADLGQRIWADNAPDATTKG